MVPFGTEIKFVWPRWTVLAWKEEDLPSVMLFGFSQITACPPSLSFPICKLGKSDWITSKGPSYS